METIKYENVRLEIEGPLATVVIDNPDRLNAISSVMVEGILTAIQEVSKPRRKIRCLMVTGEGRGFCAGANLLGPRKKPAADAPQRTTTAPISGVDTHYHAMLRRFQDLAIPIVTAVNGPAVGIGVGLALIGDIIVAAKSAYFFVNYRNLASGPDGGSTWLLPRMIGWPRARQIVMRAEKLDAEKAQEWGLVNDVFEDDVFRAEAHRVADELANGPTVALSAMRRLFQDSVSNSFGDQLEAESRHIRVTSRSKDNVAVFRSLASKEDVKFTGE